MRLWSRIHGQGCMIGDVELGTNSLASGLFRVNTDWSQHVSFWQNPVGTRNRGSSPASSNALESVPKGGGLRPNSYFVTSHTLLYRDLFTASERVVYAFQVFV